MACFFWVLYEENFFCNENCICSGVLSYLPSVGLFRLENVLHNLFDHTVPFYVPLKLPQIWMKMWNVDSLLQTYTLHGKHCTVMNWRWAFYYIMLLWRTLIGTIPMVTMVQSAANWCNTNLRSLTHLHQHSYNHVVQSASSAIIFQCMLGLFMFP